jgi:hypothetical protein
MISIIPLWTFHLYVATFQQHLHIYLSVDPIFQSVWFLQDFLIRGFLLSRKLLNQIFLLVKLKSSLRKFYDRHRYGISLSQINDNGYVPFVVRNHNPVLSSFITDHWVCNRKSNTTGFTCGTGTAYLSGASEYNPGFWREFILLDL